MGNVLSSADMLKENRALKVKPGAGKSRGKAQANRLSFGTQKKRRTKERKTKGERTGL